MGIFHMELTSEMVEHVVIDEPGGLRAAMAIIDADEGALRAGVGKGERAGLHLALVLEQVVGLHHRHGEVAGGRLAGVLVPQQPVLAAGGVRALLAPPSGPGPRAPARPEVVHHRRHHALSPQLLDGIPGLRISTAVLAFSPPVRACNQTESSVRVRSISSSANGSQPRINQPRNRINPRHPESPGAEQRALSQIERKIQGLSPLFPPLSVQELPAEFVLGFLESTTGQVTQIWTDSHELGRTNWLDWTGGHAPGSKRINQPTKQARSLTKRKFSLPGRLAAGLLLCFSPGG